MSRGKFEIFYSEFRVQIWCARRAGTFLRRKAFSLGEKVARNAPDEGEVSDKHSLISHLR